MSLLIVLTARNARARACVPPAARLLTEPLLSMCLDTMWVPVVGHAHAPRCNAGGAEVLDLPELIVNARLFSVDDLAMGLIVMRHLRYRVLS